MSKPVILVENLSKRYRIGGPSGYISYGSLRETLAEAASAPLRRLRGQPPPERREIWALKDVSFEVQRGEVLGIIGRNGAGKSTLLKILSRITKPTEGRVTLRGRVGSLLEVGTGFHPELTGRENIFLNGAILGMTRGEIEGRFDEIVDFAEIEQFLDTPVKYYSSGMYMRLAFAVAAHLEPEILLVDEVLAVGDAAFQKKCLGKMGQVASEGRTVLFVSHNMGAVRSMCSNAICLNEGKKIIEGDVEICVNKYQGTTDEKFCNLFPSNEERTIELREIELLDRIGNRLSNEIEISDGFSIRLCYQINKSLSGIHTFLRFNLTNGETVFSTGDADQNPERLGVREKGLYCCHINVPPNTLAPGNYSITWSAGIPFQVNYDVVYDVLAFCLRDTRSKRAEFIHQNRPGYFGIDLDWIYERDPID